jgi:hypothetical protein
MLMVFAIFNPFCCCSAAVVAVDGPKSLPLGHSCCQTQMPDVPADGCSDEGHDRSKCPHQALKDYQASLEKDVTAKHSGSLFLYTLLAVVEFILAEPVAQSLPSVTSATASAAPPITFSQVYCVYRI